MFWHTHLLAGGARAMCALIFLREKNLEQIRGKIREKIRETIYRAAHAKNSAESSLPSQPTLVLYPN